MPKYYAGVRVHDGIPFVISQGLLQTRITLSTGFEFSRWFWELEDLYDYYPWDYDNLSKEGYESRRSTYLARRSTR